MLSNAFEAISLEEREAKRKKSGDRGRRNEVCKGTAAFVPVQRRMPALFALHHGIGNPEN